MRTCYETIVTAFSMFSALPVPRIEWNEKNLRFLPAAFPLVGIVCGGVEALWLFIAGKLQAGPLLTAAVVCALPLIITGGIHLDGYADVYDALSSYGDAEKRKEILSDPHIGAFAVIHTGIYLILYTGFASGLFLHPGIVLLLASSFVLSRSLSGLAVCRLPLSKETGLARTFQVSANREKCTIVLGIWTALTVVVMIFGGLWLGGGRYAAAGFMMTCCAAGQWFHLKRTAKEKFGGLSGDLNGWFLQKAELWMLAALVLTMLAAKRLY